MRRLSRSTVIWSALLAALLVLAAAASLVAARPEHRAAPLGAESPRHQADAGLMLTLGFDRVPGLPPGLVPAATAMPAQAAVRDARPAARPA
ncbi:MAG: hypothetical protein WCP98_11465, partial [Actinomycetes bacterium]